MAESFTAQLIRRFQIEQKKNDHSGVYALSQKLLAYHSNRIEGGMLDGISVRYRHPDVGRCTDPRERRGGNDRSLPDVQ